MPKETRSKNQAQKKPPRKSKLSDNKISDAGLNLTNDNPSQKTKSLFLTPISGPELVIGLVGPIGTDLNMVVKILSEELRKVHYETQHIHVSHLLNDVDTDFNIEERPLEKRYSSYMNAGNLLRKKIDRADAFALLSVAAIRNKRLQLTNDRASPKPRTAYVLNQFKRPEEIETLRSVYGRGFIQISAFCSRQRRLASLTSKIAQSWYREKPDVFYRGKAHDLMVRDDDEEETTFGQRVRDTFPLADVVINADDENSARKTCSRFIRAFFNDNFVTPTKDEYGAFAANAASLRSSDLSRQVGAVICRPSGEIISVGCNEVPKAGGGTYWEQDTYDSRDFQIGYDSSAKSKRDILQDVLRRLRTGGWLNKERSEKELSNLVDEAISPSGSGELVDSMLMNILEFGRIIHAEMCAITDAARLGIPLKGSTLYSTTFPCHICARHIISAGIERVVYIEPYSKSLAAELYPDSIQIEGISDSPGPKVKFEPFIGIAPNRYIEIFSKGRRKDSYGVAKSWDPNSAEPILKRLVPAYLQIETGIVKSLFERMQEAGLSSKPIRVKRKTAKKKK